MVKTEKQKCPSCGYKHPFHTLDCTKGGSGEVEKLRCKQCGCEIPSGVFCSARCITIWDNLPHPEPIKEKPSVEEAEADAGLLDSYSEEGYYQGFREGIQAGDRRTNHSWNVKIVSRIQELEAKKKSWIKESKKYKKIRCSDSFNLCVKRCDEADNRIDELRGLLEKKEEKKNVE